MDLLSLAKQVGEMLSVRGQTLSTAESCTGGLLGSTITDLPGSSVYYLGGVITYSNELKQALLGVKATTLEKHGAVSSQTVEEMAKGIQELTGSTYALAVSGIAGPGGGTPEKPVGLVYIGLAGPQGVISVRKQFTGNRGEVKVQTVHAALSLLLS
ncbi:MAG: CinA family protein [Firmicutes bacterium]|nr:CinA family protein [Bacillota bacterium]